MTERMRAFLAAPAGRLAPAFFGAMGTLLGVLGSDRWFIKGVFAVALVLGAVRARHGLPRNNSRRLVTAGWMQTSG
jgi:hypothetical protein